MSKNIVVCMDGTWNDPTEKTNVYSLFNALVAEPEVFNRDEVAVGQYRRREADGLLAFYLEGVGARGRSQELFGGALGVGLHARVLHAYLLVSRSYDTGDKLWIFGFSRGAWSARSLAGLISKAGLLSPNDTEGLEGLAKAQDLWLRTKTERTLSHGETFWQNNDEVPIRLVGVWDTVGALGVPFFNGLKAFDRAEKHLFDFADLTLSPRVEYGRHALAIDERRKDFEPTLWEARGDGTIKQVWFAGVHGDVGGGYKEIGLSAIALEWMVSEAIALDETLKIDLSVLDPNPTPNIKQHRHDETQKKLWHLRPTQARRIPPDAVLHPSVLERFRVRSDYRPECLATLQDVTAFYAPPLPAETIFELGEPVPTVQLEVDEQVQEDVFAQNCWNSVGIEVKQNERYAITATGKWKDKNYEASAAGYESPNLILKTFERARRVREALWFCLIACVHPSPGLESRNPDAGNLVVGVVESLTHTVSKIDDQSQLVEVGEQSEITVDRDGYLYLFANATAWAYSNNSGSLTVIIRRLAD